MQKNSSNKFLFSRAFDLVETRYYSALKFGLTVATAVMENLRTNIEKNYPELVPPLVPSKTAASKLTPPSQADLEKLRLLKKFTEVDLYSRQKKITNAFHLIDDDKDDDKGQRIYSMQQHDVDTRPTLSKIFEKRTLYNDDDFLDTIDHSDKDTYDHPEANQIENEFNDELDCDMREANIESDIDQDYALPKEEA